MIQTQLRGGGVIRLRRGVFLAASVWPSDRGLRHQLLARAEVAANPDAVISHGSAAVFWGLPFPGFGDWVGAPVSVTLPAGEGYRGARGSAVHHVAALTAEDLARDAAGYPVTNVPRTAVDLAATLDLPAALAILDAAARLLCASYVTEARRRDYANPGMVQAARAQLTHVALAKRRPSLVEVIEIVDPARESVAESLSAGHFALAGLPTPSYQARIVTTAGTFFPDCLWRDHGLIGECDGAVKYADPSAHVREKEREQALRDAGFRMVRWLAKEIMTTPGVVVERVRRALSR
jgi:hypothetical protein